MDTLLAIEYLYFNVCVFLADAVARGRLIESLEAILNRAQVHRIDLVCEEGTGVLLGAAQVEESPAFQCKECRSV